ncbi:MAG: hypothetical protein JJ939_12010 [Alphaproteobacteria bacterium]|nr:hypothetical protein [Alphaproteobacteria bacterium]MBO6629137.1 hypothetical protein [Alphaproteobacteria bacterium]
MNLSPHFTLADTGMNVTVRRLDDDGTATIGALFVNGEWVCDTLECKGFDMMVEFFIGGPLALIGFFVGVWVSNKMRTRRDERSKADRR